MTPDVRHQTTPAMALGLAGHVRSIGDLIDAALALAPAAPTESAPDRRDYLKTQNDRFLPDNLLSLPECP
jgi:hypothetical protein